MKKVGQLLLVIMLVFICSSFVYAEEHSYIYHDYETGEETEFSISDNELLLKLGTLYNAGTSINESIMDVENEAECNDVVTLKEMSTGVNWSTRSLIDGKALAKVSNLVGHYKKITMLRLGRKDENGNMTYAKGTGFMIASNIMLTAGHCMYGEEGGNVDEMRVHYLQNGKEITSSFCYPASWIVPSEFKNGDPNYEWCIVFLQKHIGNTTGYFNYAVTPNSVSSVFLSGYPDDPNYDHYQYSCMGAMEYLNGYRFLHTCSSLAGHSGAPLFTSSGVVYGIHTHGETSVYPNRNRGNCITQELYNLIEYYN